MAVREDILFRMADGSPAQEDIEELEALLKKATQPKIVDRLERLLGEWRADLAVPTSAATPTASPTPNPAPATVSPTPAPAAHSPAPIAREAASRSLPACIVKMNRITLKLRKKENEFGTDHWSSLTKKRGAKSADDAAGKKDPGAGLMDLMRDLYDEGDDTMKKTIGEAMLKSRQERTGADLGDDM
ncbi:hypothetical protein T492DRAFT_838220 [Pavlovales sp. CCMP2436]|nr:hypothetical protein T492DRAFT_838220 [Pavlovales sp. CCMP2436]